MLTIPLSAAPGDLATKLAAIAEVGFEAIDLSLTEVAQFDGTLDELAGHIAGTGLRIASLGPLDTGASTALIEAKAAVAQALGVDLLILTVDGDVPTALPNTKGVRLALRPSRTAEDAVIAFVKEQNDPAIGLALNAFEILGDGSRPARLRDLDGSSVFHVTLCDGPTSPALPGQGTLNLGGFARVLARIGYHGPWLVEAAATGSASVPDAYRALVTVLSDASVIEPLLRSTTPELPAKVPVSGFEFIEFAVDEAGAVQLEAVLTSMAFRRERSHRTKHVALWRQGAVNIVINQDRQGHAARTFAQHGPCVCDMGLRVQDASETVARATALGSQDFSQAVGLGELDIPAIKGVGGSLLHFIDQHSDLHRVWDIEFEPVARTRATPPAGLRRVDHVAQTMHFEEMQSWLLYYLTTFEMTKSAIVNVADPSGIVRSQAIETPEGEVRLNLNGAADTETLAGSFVSGRLSAGVQHIAFQTDEIFETSTQFEASGFARLNVPQNYYSDTQAAFGLDDATTDDLRRHNILYDEDEHGAYFQLYGQTIFDGLFFEIVERKGRYAGYGARNAPIRLAAQTRTLKGAA
ncbi:bifunctional sugar phosphate isomerase/epimerase/4-hydroxyphenylpyruvate dioxygenase family protein [Loktanella sp. Alg231-35]|uniref:bifunctional sugar phosphate isomerase/epimerase/4-hydroxyphenylpyruvate dioxygenase family protein n=1 Tax=Loktanella sp. Alg231-35 TaxID=1922220 RepID=UPI000D55A5A7|nr:TIM barrel protein [Loktanella sp. Alg231-35]